MRQTRRACALAVKVTRGRYTQEQALLINHRIFTSSDLIKGRGNSRAHTSLDGVNLSPAVVPSLTHKQRGGGLQSRSRS